MCLESGYQLQPQAICSTAEEIHLPPVALKAFFYQFVNSGTQNDYERCMYVHTMRVITGSRSPEIGVTQSPDVLYLTTIDNILN